MREDVTLPLEAVHFVMLSLARSLANTRLQQRRQVMASRTWETGPVVVKRSISQIQRIHGVIINLGLRSLARHMLDRKHGSFRGRCDGIHEFFRARTNMWQVYWRIRCHWEEMVFYTMVR